METITIAYDDETNSWLVQQGDKWAGPLYYEEMLGLVASLTMPEGRRPCLQWMQTNEQHELEAISETKFVDYITDKNTRKNEK